MRAVIQRVTQASVKIGEEIASEIGKGLCVLVGITHEDTATDTEFIIRKILNLRLFDDPTNGKRWDKSVKDLGYDVLVVNTEFIIRKILNLRLFDDPTNGKRWDKSVKDLEYDVLVVSQFTLYGLLKGNKIDYHRAMEPTKAKEFYEKFYHDLQKAYIPEKVKDGEFGAMMSVGIVNDGPVTITIDSKDKSN
uniref:D-aminoacyl-tRNA deacylase n=1 Tax=Panagrolaimus sp. PS1159 TaxID=55785 RepID=A0AC35GNU1_9BILA